MSTSTLATTSISMSVVTVMFVTFLFVPNIGIELGYAGSKLFYDGSKTSQIVLICDDFVKPSCRLICDTE
jgi:hypothetical protein